MKDGKETLREGSRIRKMLAAPLSVSRDLVFPRRCPVCDRPVRPAGALICPECEQMLERVEEPVCRRCGKPLRSPDRHFCGDCLSLRHIYERGCAVFTYHSAAGGLFRFKYGGRQEYGAFYGSCMAQKLEEFTGRAGTGQDPGLPGPEDLRTGGGYPRPGIPRPDFLVPVPLSARRLKKRGYNQALVLAREVSARTKVPVLDHALGRVSDTLPMKNMAPAERQNNLKKAFQAFGNDVELKTIMLIDDIYTTGSTVDACADALYRRGAGHVFFMTLAIGEDSSDG